MCLGCYAEYRFPKIVSPATKRAAELIKEVYEFSSVGGNLHCEIDDWNLDDEFFEKGEMDVFREDASTEQLATERKCYAALRALTLDGRASALALYDGYLMPDGTLANGIDEAAYLAELDAEEAS